MSIPNGSASSRASVAEWTGEILNSRWLFLEGNVDYSGSWLHVVLLAEMSSGQERYYLPVTVKGKLQQLVNVPPGVKRLSLMAPESDGYCSINKVEIRRCGLLTRMLHMLKRVIFIALRLTREQRNLVRLTPASFLCSPFSAYITASKFLYHAPALDYDTWISRFDSVTQCTNLGVSLECSDVPDTFKGFCVVVDARSEYDIGSLKRTLSSIGKQTFSRFSCYLLLRGDDELPFDFQLISCVRLIQSSDLLNIIAIEGWSIVVKPGCYLSPLALFWLYHESISSPDKLLFYSDHDYIDEEGKRSSPCFKPDWSFDLALTTAYPGNVVAVRNEQLLSFVGRNMFDPYEIAIQVSIMCGRETVGHVCAILWHQDVLIPGRMPTVQDAQKLIAQYNINAKVTSEEGRLRLRYSLPENKPLVTIVIPTRDHVELLRSCIDSIFEKTHYDAYEILVINNQSREHETYEYFRELKRKLPIKILTYAGYFNYAAINNFAVQHAQGELICLMNNDVEVIYSDWLDEMVSHLVQSDVGVVGAKLYYSDGRIQHAGDVVGVGGVASHLHAYLPMDDPGYMGRAVHTQDLSAVTAACMLTKRELFISLGGLDAEHFPVEFNDVDYCLRVRDRGQRVVFTPYAALYHYESASRKVEAEKSKSHRIRQEERHFCRRWKRVLSRDPFYNPNLSRVRADFSLSHAPIVKRPW